MYIRDGRRSRTYSLVCESVCVIAREMSPIRSEGMGKEVQDSAKDVSYRSDAVLSTGT